MTERLPLSISQLTTFRNLILLSAPRRLGDVLGRWRMTVALNLMLQGRD
jgi:hypothetical protein